MGEKKEGQQQDSKKFHVDEVDTVFRRLSELFSISNWTRLNVSFGLAKKVYIAYF